jgi:hypothetical protein
MATKKKRELDLTRVLKAMDQKNYGFYESLTDAEKKEFTAFVMMRFLSSSSGDRDIQEWFIEMTNEFVNKNHWSISKHTNLTWKLCAAVGTGIPTFHKYLPTKKIELDKFEKLLGELYPSMKLDDIRMLSNMMDDNDREELFDKMGFEYK